jgi:sugar lactone lactonase YvrE
MKHTLRRFYIPVLAFIALSATACLDGAKTDNSPPNIVTADVVVDAASKIAYGGGTEIESHVLTESGLAYSSSNSTPAIGDSHTTDTINLSTFVSRITGVSPGTTYYFRAYGRNTAAIAYGSVIKIDVPSSLAPRYGAVTTFAGSTTEGFTNGTGAAAAFNKPAGAVADAAGNLYVADAFNSAIRKITPAGVVTTFAGTGTIGYKDGAGAQAQFYVPTSLAFDSHGNLFVADKGNNLIRKITAAGEVSTFAGNGSPGYSNGTATAASFNTPTAIAIDGSDNIFVADAGNNRVRQITSEGVVTTLAGSGVAGFINTAAAGAYFNKPNGIAVDATGNVYVAEAANNAIRKVSKDAVVTIYAGSTKYPTLVGKPTSVALDKTGNMFIADQSGRVLMITKGGILYVVAGKTGAIGSANGTGTAAQFSAPQAVTTDASGNIYVSDANNNQIRKITL